MSTLYFIWSHQLLGGGGGMIGIKKSINKKIQHSIQFQMQNHSFYVYQITKGENELRIKTQAIRLGLKRQESHNQLLTFPREIVCKNNIV